MRYDTVLRAIMPGGSRRHRDVGDGSTPLHSPLSGHLHPQCDACQAKRIQGDHVKLELYIQGGYWQPGRGSRGPSQASKVTK